MGAHQMTTKRIFVRKKVAIEESLQEFTPDRPTRVKEKCPNPKLAQI
uniref:Uncharacterized protein n=1 Tax=Rhizophora mucronata TaxID=61149 RepID=A0A2P2IU58_RHIMU